MFAGPVGDRTEVNVINLQILTWKNWKITNMRPISSIEKCRKSTISKIQYWNNLSPHFYVFLPVDSAQNKYFLSTLTWSRV